MVNDSCIPFHPGPSVSADSGFGDGSVGPSAHLVNPALVGSSGAQTTSTAGLLGSAPAGVLPHVDPGLSRSTPSGVIDGASLTEASTATAPLISATVVPAETAMDFSAEKRALELFDASLDSSFLPLPSKDSTDSLQQTIAVRVRAKGKKKELGKGNTSRKKKGKRPLKLVDSETDEEDRRDDDRIFALLAAGADPDDVDRMYCVEGMSVGDVERHCAWSVKPKSPYSL